MTITLTPDELALCTQIALARESLRARRGRRRAMPADRGGSWEERNIQGVMAEYALARHLGLLKRWIDEQAYSETPEDIESDVGRALEVRATKYTGGGLVMFDYDKDDSAYVLAIIAGLTVRFSGWLYGRLGKRPCYWKNTGRGFSLRPCYLVPSEALCPMETLPEDCI